MDFSYTFPEYQNSIDWNQPSNNTAFSFDPEISKKFDFSSNQDSKNSNQESGDRWKEALSVASKYLNSRSSGTSNTPYTDRARQRSSSGSNIFQATPEVTIIQDAAQPKKTTTTGGSSGIGSAIGGVVGAIGGSFIPGVGTELGASLGSGLGGLFG